MSGKNLVLITGANGFVGRHLCAALIRHGFNLLQVVRTTDSTLAGLGDQIALDLADGIKVSQTFSALQPDYVVHLAGKKNRNDLGAGFRYLYDTNLAISLNVIEACLKLPKFKRLIFLGSCDEYGQVSCPFDEAQREVPVNSYGLSKLAVTKILSGLHHSHQFPSVVLRPTVIYGPKQDDEMLLSSLIRTLLANRDFVMTSGKQYRDFVYVVDVVDAIIKSIIAKESLNGAVINIGSGISYQVKDVAVLASALIHPDASRHLIFGALPYRFNEVMDYAADITSAEELLGWSPATSLECGLKETIDHFTFAPSLRRS